MDLFEIHKLLDFFLRKGQQGFLAPDEKDRVLNRAQDDIFEELKPQYGKNQQVDDALKPFKKQYTFTNGSSPNGLITLPADYFHLLVVETVVNDSNGNHYPPVEKLGETELSHRRNDQLCPITIYYPVGMLEANNTFQLYPMQASAGIVYYLRKYADCHLQYAGLRPIVYDQGNSTQLEWNEAMTNKIIIRALSYLGINLQDVNAINFAQGREAALNG